MKHIVDIETWERKDNYNFFRGFANSWIAITSEVDCTEAYNHAKANGKSFFLYYLYAILRAANEIKEFRYRWDKNGQVVYHDTVDVISPIAVPGKTFYTVRLLSATPKLYFTSITYTQQEVGHPLDYPLMNAGKAIIREGKRIMPIALTVSHAFTDGAHISLFFEKVEQYLKEICK